MRRWVRRLLPWLPAAAIAFAPPPTASGQITIDGLLSTPILPYQVIAGDLLTLPGLLEVADDGYLQVLGPGGTFVTDDFLNSGSTTIFSGGAIQIEPGGDVSVLDGTLTVGGLLTGGEDFNLRGGDVVTENSGLITAEILAQTGGLLQVDGTVSLLGDASVTDADEAALLTVNDGGTFEALSLDLSAAALNGVAATLDGAVTLNAGGAATDGGVLNVGDGATAAVGGITTVIGEAEVNGDGSLLTVTEDGDLIVDVLNVAGGAVVVDSGGTDGLLTVAAGATIGDGIGAGGSLTIDGDADLGSTEVNDDGLLHVSGALVTDLLSTAGDVTLDLGGLLDADALFVDDGSVDLNGAASLGLTTIVGDANVCIGPTGVVDTANLLGVVQDLHVTGGALKVDAGGLLTAATLNQSGGTVTVAESGGTFGTLNLDGGSVAQGTLTVDGALNSAGLLSVGTGGTLQLGGTGALIADALAIGDGAAAVIGGDLNVNGVWTVDGGTVVIEQDSAASAGALDVFGTGSVTVDAVTTGTNDGLLTIFGATRIGSAARTGGTVAVNGDALFGTTAIDNGGALTVSGEADLGSLSIRGLGDGGTLSVGALGDLTAGALSQTGGIVALDGTTLFDSLNVSGGTFSADGTLTTNGLATFSAPGATLSGRSSFVGLTVSDGSLTASGRIAGLNGLTAGAAGTSINGGSLTVAGDAALGMTQVAGGRLNVDGALTTRDGFTLTDPLRTLTVGAGGLLDVGETGLLDASDFEISAGGVALIDGAAALTDDLTIGGDGSLLSLGGSGTLGGGNLALTDGGDLASLGALTLAGAANVDGVGSSLALNAGMFDAASLAITGGGSATSAGLAALTGGATVSGVGSSLRVSGGMFEADSLGLTDGGAAILNGGTTTLTGAANADGAGSLLSVGTAGTWNGTTLGLTNGSGLLSGGDVNLSGAAAVDGLGSNLALTAGTFDTASLALTGGGSATVGALAELNAAVATIGDGTDGGALTIAGTGSLASATILSDGTLTVDGAASADSLDNAGALFVRGSGALTVDGVLAQTAGTGDVSGTADLGSLSVTGGAFGGAGTVNVAADASFAGGTNHAFAGPLTVGGDLTVSGGNVSSAGTADADGGLTVAGATDVRGGSLTISGDALAGETNLSGGLLAVADGGVLDAGALTHSGGTLTVADGGSFLADLLEQTGGSATVAGLATLTDDLSIANDGALLTVGETGALNADDLGLSDGGDLSSAGDVNLTGAATVDGIGSSLALTGGTFDAATLAITGAGSVTTAATSSLNLVNTALTDGVLTAEGAADLGTLAIAAAGTLNADGAVSVDAATTIGTLSVGTGGTLTATGALTQIAGTTTVDGTLDGTDLTLTGGTFVSTGAVDLSGTAAVDGAGAPLTVAAGTFDAATLALTGSASVTVDAGATLAALATDLADGTLTVYGAADLGDGAVAEDGTLLIDGALSADTLSSAGTVTLNAGRTLDADVVSVTDGVFDLHGTASLGTANVAGGALTVEAGADLTADELIQSGGSVSVLAGSTLDGTTLEVTGGTLDSAGDLNLAEAVEATGAGSLLNVTAGAVETDSFRATDGGAAVIDGGTVTAAGAALIDGIGSSLVLNPGGALAADTLTISDGARGVTDGDVDVSDMALITGAGSTLDVIGGSFDTDLFCVEDGAVVTLATDFLLNGVLTVDGAGSTLNAASGTLTAGSTEVTNGGTLNVDAAVSVVDDTTLNRGTLNLRTGGATYSTDLFEATNQSTVTIAGGATLTARTFNISADSDLTLADNGNLIADDLNLMSGARLSVQSGHTATSSGRVLITEGSTTNVNGAFQSKSFLLEFGGRIGGSGTFRVTGLDLGDAFLSRGTIAPGNSPGVLTIDGDFTGTPASVFDMELVAVQAGETPVAGVDFDRLAVTGAATLDGGTFNAIRFTPDGEPARRYQVGTRYDVLTADGGLTIAGQPVIASSISGVRFAQIITANSFGLVVVEDLSSYERQHATSFNQSSVASALDAHRESRDLIRLRDSLDTLPSSAAVADALDQLSGEVHATHLASLNRSSLHFLDAVAARDAAFPLAFDLDAVGAHGLTGWMDTTGAVGRVQSDDNAGEAEVSTIGTTVGLTQRFRHARGRVALGGFYGFESVDTTVDAVRSRAQTDVHRFGASARGNLGRIYGRLIGFGGVSETSARRSVEIDNPLIPFSARHTASSHGPLAGADAEAGMLFGGSGAYVTPVFGLRYVRASQDGFTESGGPTALRVEDASLSELRARLGARAGGRLGQVSGVRVTGTLEAFYSRDVSADSIGQVRAELLGAPGTIFTTRGADFGRDRVTLGPGVTLGGGGPLTVAAFYRAGLSRESVLHAGDVRLEYRF
ncbi:hypothetical protein [Alienimonas chondri]|uniref:Autotransporter domain-containing protein n=1 Tax=Alienimonas chondri TaxID=2681879 RepID=A0ABX1VBU5_9PLAN|nr:hypothetical protein [Alienimonas chondri]NNJ25421.1 hypothetical protein [Alienimonas chondri]